MSPAAFRRKEFLSRLPFLRLSLVACQVVRPSVRLAVRNPSALRPGVQLRAVVSVVVVVVIAVRQEATKGCCPLSAEFHCA